ncbi:MAG: Uma2 family endonuclease, partial [Chloroflexia bacterium]|nr:Uma2 family endonuclease [Chloroflexia bacterium]
MATTTRKPFTQQRREGSCHIPPVTLRLRPVINLTADQLLELSSLNGDLQLELSANGELIVMSPTGSRSSDR